MWCESLGEVFPGRVFIRESSWPWRLLVASIAVYLEIHVGGGEGKERVSK